MNFESIRRTVYYTGRVQGVGFRQTSCQISRHHRVTGFVRNLPDGRVELVTEGAPDAVTRFLEAVREELGGYIRGVASRDGEATGEFHQFAVRY